MARSLGRSVENNFTGGLITEATALNFPENAVTETDNCVFDKTGSVSRRPSLQLEANYQLEPTLKPNAAISTYLWRNTGGNGDLILSVVQIGRYIYFYRSTNGAISGYKYPFVLDLNTYSTGNPEQFECQYAVGNGYLFIVNPRINPVYVSFNVDTSQFTVSDINLNIRDFSGVDDGLGVSVRPGPTITGPHLYNLYNQGWPQDKFQAFLNIIGKQPSNADVWWLLKDSQGNFKPGPIESTVPFRDRTVTTYGDLRADSVYRGNTPAPKGHFILDPFGNDRAALTGIGGLVSPITTAVRPSTVGFFSGRVFYAGVDAPNYTDKIYFSQIIETTAEFGKCYQENDPTSENIFNLLATDGGVISIPEAGQILKLFSMTGTLIVFATNGVWAITGSTGIGFSATDYTVSKISSIISISNTSFVDIEGYPAFWNDEGIYIVSATQTGQLQVSSISEKKIKAFYKTIPLASKKKVRGYYNPVEKTIQWLYKSANTDILGESYSFDKALVFNTQIEAFYTWSFNLPEGYTIAGLQTTFGSELVTSNQVVTTLTAQPVTAIDGSTVTSPVTGYTPISFKYKYLTFTPSGNTFSELNPESYLDFGTIEYSSYFITGYKLRGEATRTGQANFLYVYFQEEADNSLVVQALWDYSTSGNSGRWSSQQWLRSWTGDFKYTFRRLKIRGHGKAVQFKFSSVGTDSFNIMGWASTDSVNGSD